METGNEKQNVNIAEIQSKNNQYMKEWYWQKGGRERLSLQRKMRKFLSKEEYYKMFPKIYYNKKDNEKFIRDATRKHGNKYSYDKVLYKNNYTKVVISCPIHGDFYQAPKNHLRGQGCPKCGHGDKVFGKGINDLPKERGIAFSHWKGMLRRCYSEEYAPSYKGCEVCDEWLLFSNFKRWFDDNYIKGYQLDKDILTKGNKLYSPTTCCFVPKRINQLLVNSSKHKDSSPIGVTYKKKTNKYIVQINGYKGSYNTAEDAFIVYKKEKEAYIKDVAREYYLNNLISKQVFNALNSYKV